MAYFRIANPETILQPLFHRTIIEKYSTNGMEIEPGIRAGELNRFSSPILGIVDIDYPLVR
jgi:hypothetical protein